ncbi:MAG: DMP19 family protein [Aureispira sp.]|nr:DMP19 family protein [Aureispira sp.]
MFTLQKGNARKLHYSASITRAELHQLKVEGEKDIKNSSEVFWQYYSWIEHEEKWPKNKSWEDIWKKLTKAQKVVISMAKFFSQMNNGGLWQFFFNCPQYSTIVIEVLYNELYSTLDFKRNYKAAVTEFMNVLSDGHYEKLIGVWNDESLSFEERWAAFKSGEEYISNRVVVEESYFENTRDQLYESLIRYIERNIGTLIKVLDEDGGNKTVSISKKEAIPYFTNYLSKIYGLAPEFVKIYYTANVNINNIGTNLFLMHYKMPNGFESIGITGHFTHHFTEITLEDIKTIPKTRHKEALINTYYGWYIIDQELLNNPKATSLDETKWKKYLAKVQSPKKNQIPVNVKLLAYFKEKSTKQTRFYFTCDMVEDNKEYLTATFEDVEVVEKKYPRPKKLPEACIGFLNQLIWSNGKVGDGFHYFSKQDHAVSRKYPHYFGAGQYTLLKAY